MNLSWLQLSQKAGVYNIYRQVNYLYQVNSDDSRPIAMFNHLSLLFSPNVWRWRSARFQPFMGLEEEHRYTPDIARDILNNYNLRDLGS